MKKKKAQKATVLNTNSSINYTILSKVLIKANRKVAGKTVKPDYKKAPCNTNLTSSLGEILRVVMDYKNVHDAIHNIFSTTDSDLSELISEQFKTMKSDQIEHTLDGLCTLLKKSKPVSVWCNFTFEADWELPFLTIQEEQNFRSIMDKSRRYETAVLSFNKYRDELINKVESDDFSEIRTTLQNVHKSIRFTLQEADDLILNSLPFIDHIARKLRT